MGQAGEIRRYRSIRPVDHPDSELSSLKGDHFGPIEASRSLRQEGERPWQTEEDNPGC